MRLDYIRISKVEKVQLIDKNGTKQGVTGTLYITTTHFMFITDESNKETWVLHSHIESIERGPLSAAGCPLTIRCKTFLTLNMLILRDRDCQDVYDSLYDMSQPVSIEDVYAFSYVPGSKEISLISGWDSAESLESDLTRLGLPNQQWDFTDFNKNYAHCETYPEKLIAPRCVPKTILLGSSKFRSKGRLPVLAYFYSKSQASICRCSQPLTGFSARCVEDEELMQYILRTNTKSNVLYVVDTRPRINAMANKAAGKGFEKEDNYSNMKFYSFAIENIHVMRNSLQKMLEACSNRNLRVSQFLSSLENSGWLKHVRIILECATFIAESILKSINVVVHCSDGWDRTAQTVSLACLLLDPHYRTLDGFKVLIEKDWLSFGHKFTDRCCHIRPCADDSNTQEAAPIFTQFLDCIWQLMQQFPQHFEFNCSFLIALNDHVYSCQFGTFLGNCEKDRRTLRLYERTYSFWAYVNVNREEYLNPLYDSTLNVDILLPDIRPHNVQFWRSLYNRFDSGIHPRENLRDLAADINDKIHALSFRTNVLKTKMHDLQTSLKRKIPIDDSPLNMEDSGHYTNTEPNSGQETVGDLVCSVSQMKLNDEQRSQTPLLSPKRLSDAESGFDDSLPCVSDKALIRPSMTSPQSHTSPTPLTLSSSLPLSPMTVFNAQWQKLRDAIDCSSCNMSFNQCQRRYHCWSCGQVFCRRCVSRSKGSPGADTKDRGDIVADASAGPDPMYCRRCSWCKTPINT